MPNSSAPIASRVADYFFVAGLHDNQLIPAYEHAKTNSSISDASYYQQQEHAVANNGQLLLNYAEKRPHLEKINRRRGKSMIVKGSTATLDPPLLRSSLSDAATSASLLGVLDHVQNVIDNFDKERDSARDNVIAVQDPSRNQTERKRKSLSRSSTRKWRSPSDPNAYSDLQRITLGSFEDKHKNDVPNILELKYTPTVLMRYPKKDYTASESFPAYTAMFCFPKDISLHAGEKPPSEYTHSFTMTDENGSTAYGTCIIFYEKLDKKLSEPVDKAIKEWAQNNMSSSSIEYAQHLAEKIDLEKSELEKVKTELAQLNVGISAESRRQQAMELEEQIRAHHESLDLYYELVEPVKMAILSSKDIWVPKAIGLLGRMAWIDLYGDWLKILLDNIVGVGGFRNDKPTINIESAVINIIDEVPLPPPGRFEIGLTINQRPLFFSRPPVNTVPILKNFSLFPLFRTLSPHLILVVLETLLAEGKVLFVSQYSGMLSLACESFQYLLFPFYWQFVCIPVLPERLLTCLQAPVPYMIGFQGTMTEAEEHAPDEVCIVNLDCNSMHQSQRSMFIPERQRRKLQSGLEQYAPLHTKYKVPYGVPLPVQCAFPKGKMILNCSRSRTTDIFISPAARQPRTSESSSDNISLWSLSRPWSSNTSTRTSNDSTISTPHLPQYPGSAVLSTSTGNYAASSSSLSLHSPPLSPLKANSSVQSFQTSLSTSSINRPTARRTSLSVVNAAHPNPNGLDHQHSYRKASIKRSDSTTEDNARARLSAFMSKPRAVFQLNPLDHGLSELSHQITMVPPHFGTNNEYEHSYYPQPIPRRVKHIEGHRMVEIFTSELNQFPGFRCVCGKQVSDTQEQDETKKSIMFMSCQECHLVTHDACTDQILHPCLPACFDEQKVQDAFIRMFASLLYNYRTGFVDQSEDVPFITNQDNSKKSLYFSKERFLKHSDKDTRTFLSNLCSSQMFTQFVTDRLSKSSQDPEILVFDEYIKLKLNRSKLKFVKEETPFLNDESFRVSQIIWATPPHDPELFSEETEYERFPTNLKFGK
ncbi:AEX-3 domain-containing protein [Choanephora cucurbitarum]|nr:AEX-3 domain-containing protein [Choanephora cucurbitarum]